MHHVKRLVRARTKTTTILMPSVENSLSGPSVEYQKPHAARHSATPSASRRGQAAGRSGPQGDAAVIKVDHQETAAQSPPDYSDEPCFTEAELKAVLPPIPDYMRRGPRPKSPQRELFDRK
jgi:hypothetical protein